MTAMIVNKEQEIKSVEQPSDEKISVKRKAYERLLQRDFKIPPDFDTDKELAEALEEKYGPIDFSPIK
ncbi:MAG: hypothetical protein IJ192_06355 [Clostridia bacterium]|nr:hypothetical protein [Clostridia bacterium]